MAQNHTRTQISKSDTLVAELLPQFKQHLRILHTDEDALISMYLEASMDSITLFCDHYILETVTECTTLTAQITDVEAYTYIPLYPITSIVITDALDVDVTETYEIDLRDGYIYPSVDSSHTITITSGYPSSETIPANIKSIVYRYASHLYEHREAIQIGEPKHLPDWVAFALSSINRPRV